MVTDPDLTRDLEILFMSPPDGVSAGEVVAFRLTSLEARMESMEVRMDKGFNQVRASIESLTFVRKDVYESDQRTATEWRTNMEKDVENARKIAMWSLGVVTSLTIGAVMTFVTALFR